MREKIAEWGKRLEAEVATERGENRFNAALRPNEYMHVVGHDSSILEIVLGRGDGIFRQDTYTRIIWSEPHPEQAPFAFKSYVSADSPDKPKQEFHNDHEFEHRFLTAAEVEEILFDPSLKWDSANAEGAA